MPHTLSPSRKPPEHALGVLVVSAEAAARAMLAAQVRRALPSARVHELSQTTDLVYRVAGSGIDLVLMDARTLQQLSLTPLLVQMLKGIQPALRIVCVGQAEAALTPGFDANPTEAGLADWLRTHYGNGGVGNAAGTPSAHFV